MSFRPAGFRPMLLGVSAALVFALSAGTLLAQAAQPATKAAPANASSTQATNGAPIGTPTAQPNANALPSTAAPDSTAMSKPGSSADAQPVVAKPGDAAAGQGKAAVCGACHGMDGNSSDPQYPKLAGQHESYIARQLTHFKGGQRQNAIMMGMAAPLSEQDMHDLGAYFATKSSLPGVADAALVEQGQTLFRQGDAERGIPACMACHSMDGRGNPGAVYPQLMSQHAQYIEAKLKAWHDGETWGTDAQAQIMPAIAKKLDAKDMAALASYIEGLHRADSGTSTPATP